MYTRDTVADFSGAVFLSGIFSKQEFTRQDRLFGTFYTLYTLSSQDVEVSSPEC